MRTSFLEVALRQTSSSVPNFPMKTDCCPLSSRLGLGGAVGSQVMTDGWRVGDGTMGAKGGDAVQEMLHDHRPAKGRKRNPDDGSQIVML